VNSSGIVVQIRRRGEAGACNVCFSVFRWNFILGQQTRRSGKNLGIKGIFLPDPVIRGPLVALTAQWLRLTFSLQRLER
jgi:hypothetical protein